MPSYHLTTTANPLRTQPHSQSESVHNSGDTALNMTAHSSDFGSLRQWRGSQDQFEELCYQLRDPTPDGAVLVKTGNPDGGLEWYVTLRKGVQWGWQAKFTFNIDTLLRLMEKSLKTVVNKRPKCRRLTFCIPFDLPDCSRKRPAEISPSEVRGQEG